MKYPAQYLHSDSLVIDDKPRYQGVTVPPRRDNLFDRPALTVYTTPQMSSPRAGADRALAIPSKGTLC